MEDVIVFVDDKVDRGFRKNEFFVNYNKKVFDEDVKDFITVKISRKFTDRVLAEAFIRFLKGKIAD